MQSWKSSLCDVTKITVTVIWSPWFHVTCRVMLHEPWMWRFPLNGPHITSTCQSGTRRAAVGSFCGFRFSYEPLLRFGQSQHRWSWAEMLRSAYNLTRGYYSFHTLAVYVPSMHFKIREATKPSPKPLNANPATSKRPAAPSCINSPLCEPSSTLGTAGGDGGELSRKWKETWELQPPTGSAPCVTPLLSRAAPRLCVLAPVQVFLAVTGRVTLCVWPRACMLDVVIINVLPPPAPHTPQAGRPQSMEEQLVGSAEVLDLENSCVG